MRLPRTDGMTSDSLRIQLSEIRGTDTPSRKTFEAQVVGQGRLELPTSRLSGVRSNHLSYWPGRDLVVALSVPQNWIVCATDAWV